MAECNVVSSVESWTAECLYIKTKEVGITYRLWLIIMYQYGLASCDKCTLLVDDVNRWLQQVKVNVEYMGTLLSVQLFCKPKAITFKWKFYEKCEKISWTTNCKTFHCIRVSNESNASSNNNKWAIKCWQQQ